MNQFSLFLTMVFDPHTSSQTKFAPVYLVKKNFEGSMKCREIKVNLNTKDICNRISCHFLAETFQIKKINVVETL